ncbi:MAG: NAD(P)H-binding protein [Pseudomonadota bacterium]
MAQWFITGANGNLGKQLIRFLLERGSNDQIVAVVRRENATSSIEQLPLSDEARSRLKIEVADYEDVAGMAKIARGCDHAVHLVGILKATKWASYESAHENSCAALKSALDEAGVEHVTYMSIVGSSPGSKNACLRSKGKAEELLAEGSFTTCVLRVPMVLGVGDYASFALKKRALSRLSFGFRNTSLEQPIFAGDVVHAIALAGDNQVGGTLNLAGPECLTRTQLTQRAASILNHSTTCVSLPMGLGLAMAGLLETLLSNPPVTRAMLEVLDHDDQVDADQALKTLNLPKLTELDAMLSRVLSD